MIPEYSTAMLNFWHHKAATTRGMNSNSHRFLGMNSRVTVGEKKHVIVALSENLGAHCEPWPLGATQTPLSFASLLVIFSKILIPLVFPKNSLLDWKALLSLFCGSSPALGKARSFSLQFESSFFQAANTSRRRAVVATFLGVTGPGERPAGTEGEGGFGVGGFWIGLLLFGGGLVWRCVLERIWWKGLGSVVFFTFGVGVVLEAERVDWLVWGKSEIRFCFSFDLLCFVEEAQKLDRFQRLKGGSFRFSDGWQTNR